MKEKFFVAIISYPQKNISRMIFLLILSLIISLPLNSNYSSPARIYKSTLSPASQTTPRFSNLKINPSRLLNNLEKLATFGQTPEGGVNRVAFNDEDLAARNFIIELMRNAGLRVRIDAAANIIGYRPGLNPELPSLAMGSHLDTVPQGGKYDGALGVLSAIEVAQTLAENKIATRYPLEVIVFTDEEGGLVGSRAMTGTLTPAAMKEKSHSGWTIAEGIKRLGGDPTRIDSAARSSGELAAFVELHIEQGAWLERNNIAVGVVEGIVGINWWDIFIEGQANHAGTTPMNMRRDALLAAAHLIIAVNQIVRREPGRQVGTVGRIKCSPGAPNVIPGEVEMSLELRDLSSEKIKHLFQKISQEAQKIAKLTGTKITWRPVDANAKPALTDPRLQKAIIKACQTLNLSYQKMPSGAGHDAQDMTLIAPTGMIFVPSAGGISHSPAEYTRDEDVVNGANVLLHTIVHLDLSLDLPRKEK